jgi:hypothetical protein
MPAAAIFSPDAYFHFSPLLLRRKYYFRHFATDITTPADAAADTGYAAELFA